MKYMYTVILLSSYDDNVELLNTNVVAIDKGNALKQIIRKFPDEVEKCGGIQIYQDVDFAYT